MADRGGGLKTSSSAKNNNKDNNTNKKKYYAVASGRKPGVYETWDECKKQVFSFPNAQHKVKNNTFPPVLSSLCARECAAL
jgi:viroplasmin and RNaseH domain-containing protein